MRPYLYNRRRRTGHIRNDKTKTFVLDSCINEAPKVESHKAEAKYHGLEEDTALR